MFKTILLITLTPFFASALISQPNILANKKIQSKHLKFMHQIFHRGRMSRAMDCEIESKWIDETRKFLDQEIRVESLYLTYKTEQMLDTEERTIVISTINNYGNRLISNRSEGLVEEFRIELDNQMSTFINFSHDGKGQLTGFVLGDIYEIYPCLMKE